MAIVMTPVDVLLLNAAVSGEAKRAYQAIKLHPNKAFLFGVGAVTAFVRNLFFLSCAYCGENYLIGE